MTLFDLDRRTIMAGALAGAALSSAARAQSFPLPSGFTRFPIWPGKAPGSDRVTVREVETLRRPDSGPDDGVFAHIVTPTLTMLRPEAVGAKPNGAAMLLFPGGGYLRVAIGHEGYAIARRFAQAGYILSLIHISEPTRPY